MTFSLWNIGLIVGVHVFGVQCDNTDIGYFWHVTDFHYDATYWTTGLSCNEEVANKGEFGDYWCDSPWSLVQASIDAMARVKADVDFLIWTGDNVAHIKDVHLSVELNLGIMQNITTAMTTAFPNKKVYASLGNHDFFPSAQASNIPDEFYRKVSEMWSQWMNSTEQELFKKGGYWISSPHPGLRVVALNTNLYYTSNKLTSNLTDPADQFAWLRSQLEKAKRDGTKIMLTGHIPVGILAPGLTDWFHPRHSESLLNIIVEFSDVILASHFGHNHMDAFNIIQKTATSSQAVSQFTAPSVTPWRFKIPGKTGDAHNPGVRLIKYNRTSSENLDFDQYYMNLTESNKQNSTAWTKLYTFTSAYNVPDLRPASLRELFGRMESLTSPEAQVYCNHHVVSGTDKTCTQEMRADIYCAGLHPYMTKARDCTDKSLGIGNTGTTLQVASSWHMAVLLVMYNIFNIFI